jgi:hypothetical protein
VTYFVFYPDRVYLPSDILLHKREPLQTLGSVVLAGSLDSLDLVNSAL